MVSPATSQMIPDLKELWMISFGDGPDYVDFVFENHLSVENVFVLLKKDKLIGMLCMEPFTLREKDVSRKAVYLYAFAIHPEYRGKKLGGKFLTAYDKHVKKQGFQATVLTPATHGLFDYYQAYGYQTQFIVKNLEVRGEDLAATSSDCLLLPRDLAFLKEERDRFYNPILELYPQWNTEYLHFVGKETALRDGATLRVSVGDEKGFLTYRRQQNAVEIIEFAVSPAIAEETLSLLHERLQADAYYLRLPTTYFVNFPVVSSEILPFAMIKWYDKRRAQLHLTKTPFITYVMD